MQSCDGLPFFAGFVMLQGFFIRYLENFRLAVIFDSEKRKTAPVRLIPPGFQDLAGTK